MRVKVTQDDIDNGIPYESHRCPIARALCREFGVKPNDSRIRVGSSSINIYGNGYLDHEGRHKEPTCSVSLTRGAKEFVKHFDDGDGLHVVRERSFIFPHLDECKKEFAKVT